MYLLQQYLMYFKFQSDSINTKKADISLKKLCPLNSNLILLIQQRTDQLPEMRTPFKFQSDSINTFPYHHSQDIP